MTDQQSVGPDAIISADRSAIAYRDGGTDRAPHPSYLPIPTLARLATAGPVLTASAFAVPAAAAAKLVQMASRMARQVAVRDAERRPIAGQVEITWTRFEIRLMK